MILSHFEDNLFITPLTIINNMSILSSGILDMLSACYMQISIWKWEMHMIANYGFDWNYEGPWGRF